MVVTTKTLTSGSPTRKFTTLASHGKRG